MTTKEAANLIEKIVVACPNKAITIGVLRALQETALYKRYRTFRVVLGEVMVNYR